MTKHIISTTKKWLGLNDLFPGKDYAMTYVWLNDGGAYTIDLDKNYINNAQEIIKEQFLSIKSNIDPQLLTNKNFCKTFCYYGKNYFPNPAKWKSGDPKTICAEIKGKQMFVGIGKLMDSIQDKSHFTRYGSAAGRSR
jgi:hypothetical protein